MDNEELKANEVENLEETEPFEDTCGNSCLATLGAMVVGSGLTLGGIALVKKLKKAIRNRKAKKGNEVIDVSDDEITVLNEEKSESK